MTVVNHDSCQPLQLSIISVVNYGEPHLLTKSSIKSFETETLAIEIGMGIGNAGLS